MKASKSVLFLLVVVVTMVFAGGTAFAMHDPDTSTTVDPHAGYSTTTDFCLQCHDIHEAAGDYALMRNSTVTDTCATCHGVYTVSPTGAYDPGYAGTEASVAVDLIGFGSQSRVYETLLPYTHEGHRLGQRLGGSGPYTYSDGTSTSTAAYIPGGSTKLTRIPSWSYWKGAFVDGTLGPIDASLWDAANEATVTGGGTNAIGGLYCGSCHALHGDKGDTGFGNALPESVYHDTSATSYTYYDPTTSAPYTIDLGPMNNKLLTAMPNHTTPTLATDSVNGGVTTWTVNGYRYCGRCHDKRFEDVISMIDPQTGGSFQVVDGTGTHSHPGSVCLSCHANKQGADPNDPTQWDFPHTGVRNLLYGTPDTICISCHPAGMLP